MRFSLVWVLTVLSFGLGAISAIASEIRYVSEDIVSFGEKAIRKATPLNSMIDEDCRPKIKESVCLVGPDRKCDAESSRYVPLFEKIHDRLPEVLQKMFCRVERIYVEKELKSTAYANPWSQAIGIRQSLLDRKLKFSEWATWKEQLTFGGSLESYDTKETLPTFVSNGTHEDFVMNVVIHEFGHLFDFANDLNAQSGTGFAEGTWGALSWKSLTVPLPNVDYPDRKNVCFYDCGDHPLSETIVPRVYQDLYSKSNFLNTYTSRNAREDFADTFAFIFTYELLPELSYVLETKQGDRFDFGEELKSTRMESKVKFVEAFLRKDNLLYP